MNEFDSFTTMFARGILKGGVVVIQLLNFLALASYSKEFGIISLFINIVITMMCFRYIDLMEWW